jgi:hypothetical protein
MQISIASAGSGGTDATTFAMRDWVVKFWLVEYREAVALED